MIIYDEELRDTKFIYEQLEETEDKKNKNKDDDED